MNYNELFKFETNKSGGIIITEYKAKNDPTVTELTISSEYNGKPVTEIKA